MYVNIKIYIQYSSKGSAKCRTVGHPNYNSRGMDVHRVFIIWIHLRLHPYSHLSLSAVKNHFKLIVNVSGHIADVYVCQL